MSTLREVELRVLRAVQTNCAGVTVVSLEGEIDHGTAPDFAQAIEGVTSERVQAVLLDLSEVSYLDSGGLSVIYSTLGRMPSGGWLGAIGARPDVLRILQIGGLTNQDSFRLFRSRDDACAAASEAGVNKRGAE